MTRHISKHLLWALAIALILTPVVSARDWQSNVRKTWEYKSGNGIVKIVLIVPAQLPDSPSLDVIYDGVQSLSLTQESEFLRKTVSELPDAGVDPQELTRISVRGPMERDVAQRLAVAALHSKKWASRATAEGGSERVVEDLLNSIGAYDTFNDIFAPYGLRVEVAGVEKVAVAKCMEMKLADHVCSTHHNVFLPVSANFDIELLKRK